MTRQRFETTMRKMKRLLLRGAQVLREKTTAQPERERSIAVEFEAARSAVVPVTVLG